MHEAGLDSVKGSVNAEAEKQFEKIMRVSRKLSRRFTARISAGKQPAQRAKNASRTGKGVPVRPGLIWINTAVPITSKLTIMQLHSSGIDIRE